MLSSDQWIKIEPMSYHFEQRKEAAAKAAELDRGVRMEVHSSHTEFWASHSVPVGYVEVWACRTYKGPINYETILLADDDTWKLWPDRVDTLG